MYWEKVGDRVIAPIKRAKEKTFTP